MKAMLYDFAEDESNCTQINWHIPMPPVAPIYCDLLVSGDTLYREHLSQGNIPINYFEMRLDFSWLLKLNQDFSIRRITNVFCFMSNRECVSMFGESFDAAKKMRQPKDLGTRTFVWVVADIATVITESAISVLMQGFTLTQEFESMSRAPSPSSAMRFNSSALSESR